MKKTMPTMKDVAQEAGVALGTVSKVFNGIAVGESYRIKVEAAAKKLGYEVNQYARGLRAGTTSTVALILPRVDHPFFSALAQHICTALLQRNYRMLLYVTAAQPEAERECLGMVRQNKVDGVIALTYNQLEVAEELSFISIDRCLGPDIPCVASDNYAGGRLAAEKLLELECTHLAFLRVGSPNLSETDKRGDGFESYCRSKQVPYEMLRLDDAAAWETRLAALGADCDGDGRVTVRLNQYPSGSEDAMYTAASNVKLTADLDARESYFFLLEDPEQFQADYELLRSDWFPVEDGLYLARREFWEDRTAEHMEKCDDLWARLLKEALE